MSWEAISEKFPVPSGEESSAEERMCGKLTVLAQFYSESW
jgi:hypothetical protein